jgi:hypothetical protein
VEITAKATQYHGKICNEVKDAIAKKKLCKADAKIMGKRLVLKYGTYLLFFVALPNQLYKNVFFCLGDGGNGRNDRPRNDPKPNSSRHALTNPRTNTHTRAHTHNDKTSK